MIGILTHVYYPLSPMCSANIGRVTEFATKEKQSHSKPMFDVVTCNEISSGCLRIIV